MKKHFIKYTTVLFTGLIITANSCKVDDLNVNPNQPSVVQTGFMFNSAVQFLGGTGGGLATTIINAAPGMLYSQYLAETQYNNESRFALRQYDYQAYYTSALQELQTIIDINTNDESKTRAQVYGSNNNQIAAARILKAFIFLTITDRWGDIPYSEALKGINNLNPVFDTQKDVYAGLFKELTEASTQFDSGAQLTNDILFSGNNTNWQHWANSLRAIMALRLSKVDPTTGAAEFAKAYAAGLLASNSENVTYSYLAEQNNENPYFGNYRSRYDYAVSDVLVNTLKGFNDPRLEVYAAPTSSGTYVGLPYGAFGDALTQYNIGNRNAPGNISQIGSAYSSQTSSTTWTSFAQVSFAVAEAAKLGWIPGGDALAAQSYATGIQASMNQNDITDNGAITAYIAGSGVAYNSSSAIEQIITQKWLANFMGDGWESWAEYRRTGFPRLLDPVPGSLSPDQKIPRRQQYPQSENDRNLQNYQSVIARQGPDLLTTRIYWDK